MNPSTSSALSPSRNYFEFHSSLPRGAAASPTSPQDRAAPPVSPKLEYTSNKVTGLKGRCFIVSSRCRRRVCRCCGPRLGLSVRRNLLARSTLWEFPALLTLTVDRSHFPGGPSQAHDAITTGKYIPRLMRLLGIVRWIWVLEFQSKTGEGWPHWHLLLDMPNNWFDLARAWKLWRDTWNLGRLQVEFKKQEITPTHAVNYITKYLTKMPKAGFPLWVLNAHGIRFVQGSRSLGPLVSKHDEREHEKPEEEPEEEPEKQPETIRFTNIQRASQCGLKSHFMQEEINSETGEVKYFYRATIPLSPGRLHQLSQQRKIPQRILLQPDDFRPGRTQLVLEDITGITELKLFIETRYQAIEELNREAEFQRDCMLATNLFAQRESGQHIHGA